MSRPCQQAWWLSLVSLKASVAGRCDLDSASLSAGLRPPEPAQLLQPRRLQRPARFRLVACLGKREQLHVRRSPNPGRARRAGANHRPKSPPWTAKALPSGRVSSSSVATARGPAGLAASAEEPKPGSDGTMMRKRVGRSLPCARGSVSGPIRARGTRRRSRPACRSSSGTCSCSRRRRGDEVDPAARRSGSVHVQVCSGALVRAPTSRAPVLGQARGPPPLGGAR